MWSSDWWWYGYYGVSLVIALWKLEYAAVRTLNNYPHHRPLFDTVTKRYLIEAVFCITFGLIGCVVIYFMSLDERKIAK